jgi:CDP-diacylglycerol pyrophosphatase
MNPGLSHHAMKGRFPACQIVFYAFVVLASICARTALLLDAADTAQRDLAPNTLWEVVHNLCVPGQTEYHDPKPCLQVNLNGGIESGFAILPDPRTGTQFLLVPTSRISGIESPIIRGPQATNYFADAWEARAYIDKAVHLTLPRDGIGMAINSAASRSQDQLHIHIACIRPDALETLHKNEGKIGDQWALLNAPLFGHHYMAMWATGELLRTYNPFKLLAEILPDAARDMRSHTLVVVGLTRSDGTNGFVILADHVNKERGDLAFGEELLDSGCRIAANGNKGHRGPIGPGTEDALPIGETKEP